MSAAEPSTAPPRASPWPPIYLVSEWTTKSAPISIGRVATGVAKVESTAIRAPCPRVNSLSARMSESRRMGLAGVSIHNSRVFALKAAETASRSEESTAVTSIPRRGKVWRASSAVPA